MTIEEFIKERRGTYDKFYTMFEVCKYLNIQGLSETDHIANLKSVMSLFLEHPACEEGLVEVAVCYGHYPLENSEVYNFVYDIDDFVDPLSGEIVDNPNINELDVRSILKKFEEDSPENILAQELNKSRSLSYFYNNYIKAEGEDVTEEDIENLIKNTLKLRGKL